MKVLIPFSGGLDSTYTLYRNVLSGNEVTAAYFEITNNSYKTSIEKRQTRRIIDLISEMYGVRVNMSHPCQIGLDTTSFSLVQCVTWVYSLFSITNFMSYDEVHISYVTGDDAIGYIQDIQNLYDSMIAFTEIKRDSFGEQKKYPKLVFPLVKTSKEDIIHLLPQNIIDLCYSCENPSGMPYDCDCVPCKKYRYLMQDRFIGQKLENSLLNPNVLLYNAKKKKNVVKDINVHIK